MYSAITTLRGSADRLHSYRRMRGKNVKQLRKIPQKKPPLYWLRGPQDYFLITIPCFSRSATMPSTTACTSSRVRVRSAWEKKMRTVMDLPASSV